MPTSTPPNEGNYLLTRDALRLTGIDRNALQRCINDHVCSPTQNGQGCDLQWPPAELNRLWRAVELIEQRMPRKDVTSLIVGGERDPDVVLYERSVANNRADRRATKAAGRRLHDRAAREAVGLRYDLYLRYIPERWVAIAPVEGGAENLPWHREYTEAFCATSEVSRFVGWCDTNQAGLLISRRCDTAREPALWATNLLASPPTPIVAGQLVVDGGCYHYIPGGENPGCDTTRCFECSRLGRIPDAQDVLRWNEGAAERPHQWDDALLAADMAEPYRYGPWACYTPYSATAGEENRPTQAEHWKACRFGTLPSGPKQGPHLRTLRPQLMPLEALLPYGVGAAVLPAGIYLCMQCDQKGQRDTVSQMTSFARYMAATELTPELEDELQPEPGAAPRRENPAYGPYMEPFAQSRVDGDPSLFHWAENIGSGALNELRVFTETGLRAGDDYCIACEAFEYEGEDGPVDRYEMQLLVDARDFLGDIAAGPGESVPVPDEADARVVQGGTPPPADDA